MPAPPPQFHTPQLEIHQQNNSASHGALSSWEGIIKKKRDRCDDDDKHNQDNDDDESDDDDDVDDHDDHEITEHRHYPLSASQIQAWQYE